MDCDKQMHVLYIATASMIIIHTTTPRIIMMRYAKSLLHYTQEDIHVPTCVNLARNAHARH